MSINNIQLAPQQLSQLYGQSLVIIPSGTEQPKKENQPSRVKYLGNFTRKVLILVRYPDVPHIPEEQLGFLTNILQACKLSLEEVAILNTAGHPGITYEQLNQDLAPECWIWLGITSAVLNAPFRLNEFELEFIQNAQYVSAPPLDAMNQPGEAARAIKGKLWLILKKMFHL